MDKKLKTEETGGSRNLIRFDWALKRLLRNKADYVVLEGFLSVLLEQNIKIINIIESEGNRQNADDKTNCVDIMVENEAKDIFIIELQNCEQMDYLFRMLYGVSKAITDHMKTGENYTHVRKVYHINIVYFELGQGNDYVYHGSTSFKGIHLGDELKLNQKQRDFFGKETVPNLYPEYYILKVKDFDDYAKDNLDQWIYYLKNDVIPDNFNAPGLREARERLVVDNLSQSERAAYNAHLMYLSRQFSIVHTAIDTGRAEGLAEGLEKGEEERKKLKETLVQKENIIANAVKIFIEKGSSLQDIAKVFHIDVEEVKKYI
jgi:predicted transposase/invertase (TIGR01784 family)